MLILDVHAGEAVAHSVPLRGPLQVGRGTTCDIVLLDPTVSTVHALPQPQRQHAVLLADLGSTNGTWLAGESHLSDVDSGKRCRLRGENLTALL